MRFVASGKKIKVNATIVIAASMKKAPMRRAHHRGGIAHFDSQLHCNSLRRRHRSPVVSLHGRRRTRSPNSPIPELFDRIVNLSRRRGFVFPSAEIYGGFRSTYDYGPLGVLMLRNVKAAWWRSMVQLRDDIVGLDAAILSPPAIWEASGHLQNFTDPLVDCRNCRERFRLDKLDDPNTCPNCGAKDSFTEPRQFNLMFKTYAGPIEESAAEVYLRPETAQGMFVNFDNVLTTSRKKPPFGIAQIGKSFRNEITPGNFVFRTREFEQMEMEYFVPPEEAAQWYEYWTQERYRWYVDLGIPESKLRLRAHDPDELSHYSSGTSDVEFLFPWGWDELEGIANRGDYDLTQHSKASGERLEYFDQATGERYVPHVIEPAAGATRTMMAFLMAAYDEEEVRGEKQDSPAARLPPVALPGCGAAFVAQREAVTARPRRPAPAATASDDGVRRDAVDRTPVSPPGRDRHATVRHRRLRIARRQGGDDPRARHDGADPRADRRCRRSRSELVVGPSGQALDQGQSSVVGRACCEPRVVDVLRPRARSGRARRPAPVRGRRSSVSIPTGLDLLHLQCHLGTDTLSWAGRGARVVGLDFSEPAIETARSLAADVGLEDRAEFVVSDVYDAVDALAWSPLRRRVHGHRRALPGCPTSTDGPGPRLRWSSRRGVLYVVEIHPFLWPFAETPDPELAYPYFGVVESDDAFGSYTDRSLPTEHNHVYERNWAMGDVITAVVRAGMTIELVGEHEMGVEQKWPFMVRGRDRFWRMPKDRPSDSAALVAARRADAVADEGIAGGHH